MARVTYQIFPASYNVEFEVDDGTLTLGTARKAVYRDDTSGDKMILEGKGLEYEEGVLSDGKVQKLSFVDENGETVMTISNFTLDARFLVGDDILEQMQYLSIKLANRDLHVIGAGQGDTLLGSVGDDIISGRGGDDSLFGAEGKDVLTGGAGNDYFVLYDGFGRDTIRDFDASGGTGMQDLIGADYATVEAITRSGKNTIIDFGGGDRLTLLDVKPGQIDAADFSFAG